MNELLWVEKNLLSVLSIEPLPDLLAVSPELRRDPLLFLESSGALCVPSDRRVREPPASTLDLGERAPPRDQVPRRPAVAQRVQAGRKHG